MAVMWQLLIEFYQTVPENAFHIDFVKRPANVAGFSFTLKIAAPNKKRFISGNKSANMFDCMMTKKYSTHRVAEL